MKNCVPVCTYYQREAYKSCPLMRNIFECVSSGVQTPIVLYINEPKIGKKYKFLKHFGILVK